MKQVIRLTESDLNNIVKNSVQKILNEELTPILQQQGFDFSGEGDTSIPLNVLITDTVILKTLSQMTIDEIGQLLQQYLGRNNAKQLLTQLAIEKRQTNGSKTSKN